MAWKSLNSDNIALTDMIEHGCDANDLVSCIYFIIFLYYMISDIIASLVLWAITIFRLFMLPIYYTIKHLLEPIWISIRRHSFWDIVEDRKRSILALIHSIIKIINWIWYFVAISRISSQDSLDLGVVVLYWVNVSYGPPPHNFSPLLSNLPYSQYRTFAWRKI